MKRIPFAPRAVVSRTTGLAAIGAALAAVAILTSTTPASAQGIWPERAENLQSLPADFPRDRLRAVMQGFTRSLGVRCSYCHVGEEGQPLSTYDFASDDHPNKDRTRAMLAMLGDINEHLDGIDPSGPERVNMWCHTCHAGKPRPMTLEETLNEAYREDGAEVAVERFLALRGQFYGGNQYDFRAPAVEAIASGLQAQGDTATAVRFLELNVEHYPDRGQSHEGLGRIALAQGDRASAIRHYERALELAGDDERNRQRITEALERARAGGQVPVSR